MYSSVKAKVVTKIRGGQQLDLNNNALSRIHVVENHVHSRNFGSFAHGAVLIVVGSQFATFTVAVTFYYDN